MIKIETQKQFNEFLHETIPQALFHVLPTDREENGIRCDELILLGLLNDHPEALKFKSLVDIVNIFLREE